MLTRCIRGWQSVDMLTWLLRHDERSFLELFAAMAWASFSFCSAVSAWWDVSNV